MPIARHVRPPKLLPVKRPEIQQASHSSIDIALKDLRPCSRRLSAALQCMEDELRILERLYYKGCNQHRLALFWRKVEEMRKYGRRVVEMRLLTLVDDLRYTFYVTGLEEQNPNVLKKAWVQAPDLKYIGYVSERVRGAQVLTGKAQERFVEVNRAFVLMMQTGAFLHLVVTLVAIVSRLNALIEEIREVLDIWYSALISLEHALKGEAIPEPTTEVLVAHGEKTEVREPAEHNDLEAAPTNEDLGQAIVRESAIFETIISNKSDREVSDIMASNVELFPMQHDALAVTTTDSRIDTALLQTTVSSTVSKPSKRFSDTNSVPRAKKKKKDAIDDIFGSL